MKTRQRAVSLLVIAVVLSLGASASHAEQKIGTRQIHLDFHTSEHLPDIGKEFSKEQFQNALKVAHVNAINTSSPTFPLGNCRSMRASRKTNTS